MIATRRFPTPATTALLLALAASAACAGAARAFPGTAFSAAPEAEAAFRDRCVASGESPAPCRCLMERLRAGLGDAAARAAAGGGPAGFAASSDPGLADALREARGGCTGAAPSPPRQG